MSTEFQRDFHDETNELGERQQRGRKLQPVGPLQPKLQIYWFARVQNGSNTSFSWCFKGLSECTGARLSSASLLMCAERPPRPQQTTLQRPLIFYRVSQRYALCVSRFCLHGLAQPSCRGCTHYSAVCATAAGRACPWSRNHQESV